MKILMICEFYDESLTYQENLLVKHYLKHGHDVTVLASTFDSVFDFINDKYDRTKLTKISEDNGARIIKLPYQYNILNRLRALSGVEGILKKELPDLIFVHDITPNLWNCTNYVLKNPSCRMILDYHADYSNSGKNWLSLNVLHGIIRKWFLDKARPHLQRIFPVTPASLKFLHEIYEIPHEEMELLPLGADLDMSRVVQTAKAGTTLRKKYSIPQDSFVIFTGGKLSRSKQTEELIDAFLQLNRTDAWLVVIGNGSHEEADYIKMLHDMAKAESKIIFTGWLNSREVLDHLDMSDIAIFPASQSILWQQAIGMGKPLVIGEPMARPGGNQDISYLNTYNNIRLTQSLKPSALELAGIMKQLFENPDSLNQMAYGAQRVASEILDWNIAVTKTLRFN